ncbi:hypothetical protein [Microbacterium sp. USHLN186]|uniref:hypothetical protein n=1 Tax=Microbacterium sp. USHLN186 TaxID=3081286 RepID=UPI00301A19BA
MPHGVAVDIRNGIAEELTGLDQDAAQQRITRLGDPDEIALLPLVAAVLLFAVSAMTAWWGGNPADDGNPLVPVGGLATWHSALLLSLLLFPISGLWLLWRLRGRPAP